MNENNEALIAEIASDLRQQKIRHGSCTIEVVFHDGRVTYYVMTTSVRRNVLPKQPNKAMKNMD